MRFGSKTGDEVLVPTPAPNYNLIGRKIECLRMVTGSHVTGVGNIGPQIDRNLDKKNEHVELTRVEGGVHFKFGKAEAFIPDSNIVSLTFKT